jgi:hypothetical protein
MAFAQRRARERFHALEVCPAGDAPIGLLVVSHVINELTAADRHALLAAVARAEAVVWVEPGSHHESRALGAVREVLRHEFRIVGPCPHGAACGVLAPDRARDWCHQFAKPPAGVCNDPEWARFASEVGVDLRSLPYSWLALDRRPAAPPPPEGIRLLGRPGFDKVAVRALGCHPDGSIAEVQVARRTEPDHYRHLHKHPHANWLESGGRSRG